MMCLDKIIQIKIIISTLIVQVCLFFGAYAAENTPEKVDLHIDKSFYLTGETIWYKLYNTNYHDHSDHSEIMYVNVHEKSGGLLIQQKLKLEEGRAHGSIDIPLSWDEDFYYITCFTNWNLQFGAEGLSVQTIPIYNLFTKEINKPDQSQETVKPNSSAHQDNINLELAKKVYHRREKVSANIIVLDGLTGNCSVSIHSLNDVKNHVPNDFLNSTLAYDAEPRYFKEKGLIIEGVATDSDSKSNVNSDVLSMYKVGENKFSRAISKDGIVRQEIEDFNGFAKIQLFDMNPYQSSMPDFKLKVLGEKLSGMEKTADLPIRNETINTYIKNATLSRKIHEIFGLSNLDSLQNKLFVPIPFKADKLYQMEKYKSMKTLKEFLKEIVVMSQVKEKDGITTVRLKNSESQRFFMEKPWYLVDGYLTRDEELVLSIPFKNLSRVEIFNTNGSILSQLEAVMIRSGMIAVYTDNFYLRNQLEASNNIVDFQGYSISRDFQGVDQITISEARENPDFRSLLYWNPNVNVKGEHTVEFVTSDLLGNFIIRIEGITDDGQRLSGSKIFSVNN